MCTKAEAGVTGSSRWGLCGLSSITTLWEPCESLVRLLPVCSIGARQSTDLVITDAGCDSELT